MILAENILSGGQAEETRGRIAVAVAGDNQDSKRIVMQLIGDIGFDSIDAGAIAESWRRQPGSPVYCSGFDADGVRRALGEARPERPAAFRATANSPGTYEAPA